MPLPRARETVKPSTDSRESRFLWRLQRLASCDSTAVHVYLLFVVGLHEMSARSVSYTTPGKDDVQIPSVKSA